MSLIVLFFSNFLILLAQQTAQDCLPNECLSQYNWCGVSGAHCGEGCKAGPCCPSGVSCNGPYTPPVSQPKAPVSQPKAAPVPVPVPVPKSSPQSSNPCQPNECLSQWGYCGFGPDYCGQGCRAGACIGPSTPPVSQPKAPVPVPAAPKPVSQPVSQPKAPVPVPSAPKSTPQAPVPVPVAAPASADGCTQWKVATMSGYDNLDGGDDMHPGCLEEYCGTNDAFLNAVPVVSILERDFSTYKYHYIDINYKNKIGTVQVWDECVNADCPNGESACCTNNAKQFGGDFLLDVDRHALKNLWGLSNYEILEKVDFRICKSFNPKDFTSKLANGGASRLEGEPEESDPTVPGWGWGLIALGILCFVGLIIGGVFFMVQRKSTPETV